VQGNKFLGKLHFLCKAPVAAGGLVYLTSGFRGSALQAIRLGREGDLTGTNAIVWSHGRNTP
jgi:hypothetical protein